MGHYEDIYDRDVNGNKRAGVCAPAWEPEPYPEYFEDDWEQWQKEVEIKIEEDYYKGFKKGKDKEGKLEGARYAFVDCWPLVTGLQDDDIAEFAKIFAEVVNSGELHLKDVRRLFHLLAVDWQDVVKVRSFALSTGKYCLDGYKSKIDINDLWDAIARHLIKYCLGELEDNESSISHLAHIAANLLIIANQIYYGAK